MTAFHAEVLDVDPDRLATRYDVATIKKRQRGRPAMGTGPAEIVPVRLDPQLGGALDDRVEREHSNRSDIIRRALRQYLAS